MPANNMTPDESDYDAGVREMFVLLYSAIGRLRSMRRLLAAKLGLDASEFAVIMALDHLERSGSTTRVRDVAQLMHAAPANVTSISGKLEAKGWVTKTASTTDSRSVTLALTQKSRQRLDRLRDTLKRVNAAWFGNARPEAVRQVSAFMNELIEHHEKAEALCAALEAPEYETIE